MRDSRDCPNKIDLINVWFVDGSIVLGRQKDGLIATQRGLQRPHAGRPAYYKGDHCVWEDDHVPNGDHRTSDHVVRCAVTKFVHYTYKVLLARLLQNRERGAPAFYHFAGHHKLLDLLVRGWDIHYVEHQFLENHPQSPSSYFTLT